MMANPFENRIHRTDELIEQNGYDALIVATAANFYYFTGVWIDPHERLLAIVFRKGKDPIIIAPVMHREDFSQNTLECFYWQDGEDAIAKLAGFLSDSGIVSIDNLWQSANLLTLMKYKPNVRYVESGAILNALRLIKDAYELECIRKSGATASKVMEAVVKKVIPGMREIDLVEELKTLWKHEGVYALSFEPIVGAGPNGANPHHAPGGTRIQAGDMVIIDMGGLMDRYCSDMTRTVGVQQVTSKQQEVYELVKAAHLAGFKTVKPGIPVGKIDKAVRKVIMDGGYGEYFTHRTGHGLGIEIHEEPSIHSANELIVQPGMVFSIEPGIYLPNQFGVRIEDIVIVTENGCESVNQGATKDLVIV
ncbi:Xaa-Pro peptidase family protein [Paenibacillus alkaliterrae]|uniref:M24 family metallopeptidase n=1 Tax=Paenibacillus alkaliterrae TaxID=320909 RepID=UPI001F15E229|nr:Xaa-Pro peptidase family protein [Paenibacillus alkaliterrae]MCF2938547.1 Xaa-Pro peptidase family protein [Paenibacillus alkaliterrae]